MKMSFIILFLSVCMTACKTEGDENAKNEKEDPEIEMKFDEVKWKTMHSGDYPYREKMLNDVVYNDTVRALKENRILELLGDPDRRNENYLYYTISQTRLGSWTLNSKSMVIKLKEDGKVEWIKIHG